MSSPHLARMMPALPRIGICVVSAAIALAMAAPAQAQIINVLSVVSAKADEGFNGSLSGGLDWRTGNTQRLAFSLGPVARYRLNQHLFIVYGSGEHDRETSQEKVFGHGRYRYEFLPWLTGETFTQAEYNKNRGLELRLLAGAGPLFVIFDRGDARVSVAAAYMLEYEEILDSDDSDLQHRISSYLAGSVPLVENVQFNQTVYVQPRIDDFGDIRILNESQISIQLTTNLAFNTALTLAYDPRPPGVGDDYDCPEGDEEGRKCLDSSLKSSITYEF